MADSGGNSVVRRGNRRWCFAGCVFDERSWTLTVRGKRAPIETKPLELLRELLLRPGAAVSKAELLDAIWPDVSVVEASLPTAARKLRAALNGDGQRKQLIETVPRIGYRLAVPVKMEEEAPASLPNSKSRRPRPTPRLNGHSAVADFAGSFAGVPLQLAWGRMLTLAAGLSLAAMVIAFTSTAASQSATIAAICPFNQGTAANALRKLDVESVEAMLAAGWDPNAPFDTEGTSALGYLLNTCEWDPDHDQRKLLLMARTLIDGGNRLDRRNVWGDTPYSIAKADRYCGPNHPVTKMMRTLCYAGYKPLGDRCLAAYELAAKRREARSHAEGQASLSFRKPGTT